MITIHKCSLQDVKEVKSLIEGFAGQGKMLARSIDEIYSHLRDYFVAKDGTNIVGCVALYIMGWDQLAEVKALAVAESYQGKGVGTMLVEEAVREAPALGITRVFALTFQPAFFKKLGFREVEKTDLPQKIWTECIRCPQFPDCNETALIKDV